MYYPADMTQEDIEQFEYEYNRIVDIERGEGQFWAVNAELQVIADTIKEREMDEQDFFHDELERDHDEPYEMEGYNDNWYDEQYEVDFSDF